MSKIYHKNPPKRGKENYLPPPPGRPLKNNDNPVPSLDNLLKQYIEYRDSDIMEGVECGNVLAFIYFLKYNNLHGKRFILQKECKERLKELQNGVETDKEQPIEKAKRILQKEKDKKTCIKAGICNICGSPLKTEVIDDKDFDSHRETFCSKDVSHLNFSHDFYYHDDDY